MKAIALRLPLVQWSIRWSNSFLTAATTTAWAPPPVILFQLPARWLRLAKTSSMGFLTRGESFVAAVSSIDWPQLKATTSRWLRQPCDPAQWRLLDSRLFEEVFGFNHKKM